MSWGNAEDEQRQCGQDRQALADLLVARGHREAAVVVASSEFSTEWSDYDSDGLCVRLAVQPHCMTGRAPTSETISTNRALMSSAKVVIAAYISPYGGHRFDRGSLRRFSLRLPNVGGSKASG
jgi:hypothetical protein